MKIEYLHESGVFGSYKKATTQSNIDNVKKELTRDAALHILEKNCDELAELYLDMLNEVNLKINEISNKYKYKTPSGKGHVNEDTSNLLELSNYIIKDVKDSTMSTKREWKLNLIKNVYCNKHAIEYMSSHGCFILPLIDTKRWRFPRMKYFKYYGDMILYKNMTKIVAEAAENIIKSHLSKFPIYASSIPNKVKIVLLQNSYHCRNNEMDQLFSYMGINSHSVDFEYPGHGSSCLNHILNNFNTLVTNDLYYMNLSKLDKSVLKAIVDPSPWMLNKIVFLNVITDMPTLSANNFYSIKLLKIAIDKGILSYDGDGNPPDICIEIENVLKNVQCISKLKQEVSNNGLDKFVWYFINDRDTRDEYYAEYFTNIGKEITPKQAAQEGIEIDDIKRRVYEFDYNNASEVKSAAKNIINLYDKFLTDTNIKKMIEDKIEEYLPSLMSKVLATKPRCVSSSNKILLCDYYVNSKEKSNIRVIIDPKNKVEINKKGNLVFYIAIDFKLPVRGVNTKYNITEQDDKKKYEHISGKKIKIEFPL